MATDDMSVTALAMDPGDEVVCDFVGHVTYAPDAPDAAGVSVPLDRETFVRGLAMQTVMLFAERLNPEPKSHPTARALSTIWDQRLNEAAEVLVNRISAFIDKGSG